MSVIVSALQFKPDWACPDVSRERLLHALAGALGQGASLVVTPEMSTTGYVWEDARELWPHAEAADGPTFAAIAALTKQYGAWVVAGFAERGADALLYNSAMIVGPDGALHAVYRKVLLYELDETWATPGDRRLLMGDVPRGLVPGICMDLNDPGHTAWLARSGAGLHAFCTNWLNEDLPILPYWQRRHAGFHGYVIAANTWGEERGVRFRGESAIFAAEGPPLALAGLEGDEILLAELPEQPMLSRRVRRTAR